MPPCAAMLCARRGLSWKQKHRTWYPSSASVAAAAAPASPLPTTRTSNLRLFAGATSFISKRCLSHFWARGPEGSWASSFILGSAQLFLPVTEQHRDGDRTVTEEYEPGCDFGGSVNHGTVNLVFPPDGLKQRAGAVTEMEAKQTHREEVKAGDQRMREAGDHHAIDVVSAFVLQLPEILSSEIERLHLHGEVQQMINHEPGDDQSAHQHGARGVTGGRRIPVRVWNRARCLVLR